MIGELGKKGILKIGEDTWQDGEMGFAVHVQYQLFGAAPQSLWQMVCRICWNIPRVYSCINVSVHSDCHLNDNVAQVHNLPL